MMRLLIVGLFLIPSLVSITAFAQAQSGVAVDSTSDSTEKWFSDLYMEGNYLGDSDNVVGFGHLRAGKKISEFEIYGAARSSTDTQSSTSPLGQVYNDNFIFVGLGVDYIPTFIKGFRLRGQVGASFNLLDRPAQKQGFDFQTGLITYHEGSFGSSEFSFENYGEALYIHRYENMLVNNQFRLLYRHFESQSNGVTWGAYPIVMGVMGLDTSEIFYNRFLDLRSGVRLQARSANWVFSLTPQYVTGKYLIQDDRSFNEFRLLAVLYIQIF